MTELALLVIDVLTGAMVAAVVALLALGWLVERSDGGAVGMISVGEIVGRLIAAGTPPEVAA